MTNKPMIKEREIGPLVVKGVTRMVGSDGVEIKVKPVMALCRCGGSGSKPYCDGSHRDAGWRE